MENITLKSLSIATGLLLASQTFASGPNAGFRHQLAAALHGDIPVQGVRALNQVQREFRDQIGAPVPTLDADDMVGVVRQIPADQNGRVGQPNS